MINSQGAVGLLCDLIALPSANPDHLSGCSEPPFGEWQVADYIEEFFRPFDVRIEREDVLPGRPNILVHIAGTDHSAQPLLLEAHMDTVPQAGMDSPFTPRVADGRVYGRGACDTKASLASMMMAARAVLAAEATPRRGICLAGIMDEEYMARGIFRLLERKPMFSGAVIGEPTNLQVIANVKGSVWFKITTHGEPGHASNPDAGLNAIYLMTDVIGVLRRRIAVVYPGRPHPLLGPAVLSVGNISGGADEPSIVPTACQITIDHRYLPGTTVDEAFEEMKSWIRSDLGADTALRVEFASPMLNVPPLNTDISHPLVLDLLQVCQSVLGQPQSVGFVPFGTEANLTGAAGIPSVVFGPGHFAQAHSANEYVEVEQLLEAVEILKKFVLLHAGSPRD